MATGRSMVLPRTRLLPRVYQAMSLVITECRVGVRNGVHIGNIHPSVY